MPLRLALYEPDIPQNTGALIRLATCLGLPIDVIEPCGFPFSERDLRRSALDYYNSAEIKIHASWSQFLEIRSEKCRILLLTTKAATAYTDFSYHPGDVILLGRESAGAPKSVHAAADARLRIPLVADMRSINVTHAAAMVTGEALRQINGFPTATV
jgi:tRNA (cytidine/uridine-2'-O-)-methyltransferase